MKIYVLAPRENWICDRIAEEWTSNNPDVTTDDPHEADILWLLAGWCWNHLSVDLLTSKKTIVTVHHIVPEKFDASKQKDFVFRDQFVDAYHVPNEGTGLLLRRLTSKPIFLASYWYDESKWESFDTGKARKELGLPKSSFIIGSFQRDTEGNSGLPKLEKGPDILCEVIQKLSENISKHVHVLLGGWRRSYVTSELERMNISYTLSELASIEDLRKMYAACSLYIVSSRHEGGPQAILEAASMKTPIISRDVGIASDVLSPYCILDLPSQLSLPSNETIDYNFNSVQRYEIKKHKMAYLNMFERTMALGETTNAPGAETLKYLKNNKS